MFPNRNKEGCLQQLCRLIPDSGSRPIIHSFGRRRGKSSRVTKYLVLPNATDAWLGSQLDEIVSVFLPVSFKRICFLPVEPCCDFISTTHASYRFWSFLSRFRRPRSLEGGRIKACSGRPVKRDTHPELTNVLICIQVNLAG